MDAPIVADEVSEAKEQATSEKIDLGADSSRPAQWEHPAHDRTHRPMVRLKSAGTLLVI